MNAYEFIKAFQEIKLSKICKEKNINLSNLVNGKTSNENYEKVKNEIVNSLLNLLKSDCLNTEKLVTFYLYNELLERLEKENNMLRRMI